MMRAKKLGKGARFGHADSLSWHQLDLDDCRGRREGRKTLRLRPADASGCLSPLSSCSPMADDHRRSWLERAPNASARYSGHDPEERSRTADVPGQNHGGTRE